MSEQVEGEPRGQVEQSVRSVMDSLAAVDVGPKGMYFCLVYRLAATKLMVACICSGRISVCQRW